MNIFVAKLNPATTGGKLQQLFEQFGEVTFTKVVMDRETGRSKCYGFVEMANDEDARNAISSLDQSDFDGNRIVVKEAEPREKRAPSGNRSGGDFRSRPRYDNPRRSGGGGGYNSGYDQ